MPTYNEKENIEEIAKAIFEEASDVHLLIIDDGSPDGTGDIADRMATQDDRIAVLHREGKLGLGTAYLAGFGYALERDYEQIFEMDADFSHKPSYLPAMREALQTADMVVGSRYVAGGGTENWSFSRRFISRGGGIYARSVLGMKVQDLTAGFVGYRRKTLQKVDLSSVGAAGYGFQIEMKYRVHLGKMTITEIPIVFADRAKGTSKMSGGILFEALFLVWKLRFKVRRQLRKRAIDQ